MKTRNKVTVLALHWCTVKRVYTSRITHWLCEIRQRCYVRIVNTVDQLHYHITTQWDHQAIVMSSSLAITLQQLKKDKRTIFPGQTQNSRIDNCLISRAWVKELSFFKMFVHNAAWVLTVCKAHAIYERDKY